MPSIFNQYSFVFLSLGILLLMFIGLRILRARRIATLVTMATVVLLLIVGQLILRPGLSDVNSVQAAETLLTNGKPSFIEFFSNYCLGCVAARPAVDQLVSQIQGDFNILRVDIHTDFGRDLREKYRFSFTPEFVLFDTSGKEVWRAHVPPANDALSLAKGQSK
jgi:thiol-disulfide isomerase/thioredoxin